MTLPKWNLGDIRERMFNRPLMVSREKAIDAVAVMGPRLDVGSLWDGGGQLRMTEADLRARATSLRAEQDALPGDSRLRKLAYDPATDRVYETLPYELWQGAAIFEVRGTLMAENGLDPSSGATGYDGLSKKVRTATDDKDVLGGILDIDSPGGEVVDLIEVCQHLREFASVKPLRAVIRGQAASAGYALAACAGPGNITAASYSMVGSIGSIMMHADYSKFLEEEGVDVTLITSAAHKADGSWTKPLEAEIAARLQAMVSSCAEEFIAHVAAARGQSADAIRAQEARFYSGQDALDLGLVDQFMSWDDSMKEFAETLNRRGPGAAAPAPTGARSTGKGPSMSTEANAPAADTQPGYTEAQMGEARIEAAATAVTEERQRVSQLVEIDAASTVSIALASAIAEGTTAGEFAVAQAKAAKAKLNSAAEAAASEAVAPDQLPEASRAGNPAAKPETNRGKAFAARKAAAKA